MCEYVCGYTREAIRLKLFHVPGGTRNTVLRGVSAPAPQDTGYLPECRRGLTAHSTSATGHSSRTVSDMTRFLSQLDVVTPNENDVTIVFLKHPTGTSLCWAAVQGDKILTWDGWYTLGIGHDLTVLTELGEPEAATEVAAAQLGPAMLGSNIFPGQGSVLHYLLSHLNDESWTPSGSELALLLSGRIVSYLVLGPIQA